MRRETYLAFMEDGKEPDVISLNAKEGKFDPFLAVDLVRHLGIEEANCLQKLDLSTGQWITHLRSSPAVSITKNSTIHMKRKETNVEAKDVIALTAATGTQWKELSKCSPKSITKRKKERNESLDAIDLTGPTDNQEITASASKTESVGSPKKKQRQSNNSLSPSRSRHPIDDDLEIIGTRPAKIATFPAALAKDMILRFEWIAMKETEENAMSRFEMVYSCKYRRSTFYKHKRLWKWLRDNGALMEVSDIDLWTPLARVASGVLKNKEEAKDLTTETDEEM